MFRLIKLAAYALLGYVLYELVLGISESERRSMEPAGKRSQSQPRGQRRQPQEGGEGRTMGRTGQGLTVPVSDTTGAERTERVGRGVVSR
jgi:hypothetical protein